MALDLKITGGNLLDGTGTPAIRADLGIDGDRIEAIGDLSRAEAKKSLDVTGKLVCPGFIDAHSHSDTYLLIEPSAPSKIFQGITTEVVGNCGASAAPVTGDYHLPSDWADKTYPGRWSSVAEYRALLEQARPAPNVILLIGHNNLRAGIMGYANRPATEPERRAMVRLLEESLDQGGKGLSSGLIYSPGMFSSHDELTELAAVAARRNGIYTTHMRNEGEHLPEAVEEALSIGRETGIRVEISHLKTSGKDSWQLLDPVLEMIVRAQNDGIRVAADRYPYTAGNTDLDVVFPAWAAEGGRVTVLERLRNPADRARIREDLLKSRPEADWQNVMIGSTSHPANLPFRGMNLAQIAERLNMNAVDTLLHLLDLDDLKTGAFFFGMSEKNMMTILSQPYVMIGTDASLRALSGPLSRDFPHPRAYGSFPNFLRMALDGKTVPVEEAIRKTTSLAAEQFGIKDRGILASGKKADVIVMNPETLLDRATYSEPHQLASGIEQVIINGSITIRDGTLTGRRTGRVL